MKQRLPTASVFSCLSDLSAEKLEEYGLRCWSDTDKRGELWLFPEEWYGSIPAGFPVTSISYATRPFYKGMDNDTRFGMLAFGIIKNRSEPRVCPPVEDDGVKPTEEV